MIPNNAISIWVTDGILHAHLPNARWTEGQGHTIKLPLTVMGVNKLIDILRARNVNSRLNERGDPTQAKLDRELLQEKVKDFDPNRIQREKPKLVMSEDWRSKVRAAIRKVGL